MEPIEALLDEVRLLWHAMVRSGERLHQQEPITLGMRAILEFLTQHGPAAVPHVARSRGVSRQHVQSLVDALLELELVALEPNPAHRRSALVRLTAEGRKAYERMRARERRLFGGAGRRWSAAELERAAHTLRTVREARGGEQ